MGSHRSRVRSFVVASFLLGAAAAVAARPWGYDAPSPPAAAPRVGGTVTVDSFWSQALGAKKRFLVYLPPSYSREPTRRYPVAFYLHGIWGSESDWVKLGGLDHTADSLVGAGMPEMILVMPDGDDGWYTTWNMLGTYAPCVQKPPRDEPAATYCVPWTHYDDYVARDLVKRVDSTYRTRAERRYRGIAGLSMGGYGAITVALRYPDVFSVAVSHSGVLSPLYAGPHPFDGRPRFASDERGLQAVYGDRFWPLIVPAFGRDLEGWRARDPARMIARLVRQDRRTVPEIMLDVGTSDDLADQTRAFRAALDSLGVRHTYAEWPGEHNWPYWRRHAVESLTWLGARIGRGA